MADAGVPLLDTNVVLRAMLRDDPRQSEASERLLARVNEGSASLFLTDLAVAELVYVLKRPEVGLTRAAVAEKLTALVMTPGILTADRVLLSRALDNYARHNIDFADAYHAAFVQTRSAPGIYSFDRDFDRIPGVERIEP